MRKHDACSTDEDAASRLDALNAGTASARTLSEALAIDHAALLQAVLPDAGHELRNAVARASDAGIMTRMRRIGAALADQLDAAEVERLSSHASDTVRGWVCFVHAQRAASEPTVLLEQLRRFAGDEHFAVREWAWMAARPTLVSDLPASITMLAEWTADPSERVRRFASEVLRPRGVWARHIPELKRQPELGEPILHPLRSDPSRYVQDSVANWINDASKTRPDWAVELCRRWTADGGAATARIVARALRSVDAL